MLGRSNSVFSFNLLAGDVLAGDVGHSHIEQMNVKRGKRGSIARAALLSLDVEERPSQIWEIAGVQNLNAGVVR